MAWAAEESCLRRETHQLRSERQTTLKTGGIPTQLNNKEFLTARINHSAIKIDIKTSDVTSALSEIRKIVEALNTEDNFEDITGFELRSSLSEEFMNNQAAVDEIRGLINQESQYRIIKETLPGVQKIDFIDGKKSLIIKLEDIRELIDRMMGFIEPENTRHAIIHIKGLLSGMNRMMIIDRIHQKLPQARIKAYQTEQDIDGKALIEAVFFGNYTPYEE